jgi:cysteine-rich repeat protein
LRQLLSCLVIDNEHPSNDDEVMHRITFKSLCLVLPLVSLAACNGDDGGNEEVGETSTATESSTTEPDTGTESSSSADTTSTEETTDPTTEETTDPTTTEETTDPTTTEETTDPTTTESTTEGQPAMCGNGVIEDVEECDDGNNLDDDGCLSTCVNASCGDGFINMGVEVCDDGINDGSYGGCAVGCAALGPYCGDGTADLMFGEACDDANADSADGCQADCAIPQSCLTLKNYDAMLSDGTYLIVPPNYVGDPIAVWCDMTSDGGGYTFLKVDQGAQYNAAQAEAECDAWGMQLWIPRTLDHKNSGWAIANDAGIGDGASPDYMRILGIYPNFNGATCANQPMNSSNPNCGWDASDDGPWYVHAVNNISEPNGDNNVTGSMYYQWNNGNIQWHNDIGGAGYTSAFYMCDVGDKQP